MNQKMKWGSVLFLVVLSCCLLGCTISKKEKANGTPEPTGYELGKTFTGVVKMVNASGGAISFHNISSGEQVDFLYTEGTKFLGKYETPMSVQELSAGMVTDVYVDSYSKKLTKVQVSAEVTEYDDVRDLTMSQTKQYVTMGGLNYQYDSGLVVASGDNLIDLQEIVKGDRVSAWGIKGKVYSIVVSQGHGYIHPTNYKDFVGGTVVVEGETMLPVTDNMLIPVSEGTHEITMSNGDYTGSRTITVERNQEIDLDMSEFKSQPSNKGKVEFDITPKGAELYINGTEVKYTDPIPLKYGKHSIQVVLEGYTTYEGILNVQSSNPVVKIDLAEEDATVDSEDDSTSVTTDSTSSTNSSSVTYDNNHTITVSTPKGAEVYMNGTYKGTAPCSFTKAIGSITITLSKTGYTTKSYTVEITDDDKDVLWNFADLVSSTSSTG